MVDKNNKKFGIVLRADGTVKTLYQKKFRLAQMKEIVGGYIEIAQLSMSPHYDYMVVNEEGKLKGLPYNEMATALYILNGGKDMIVGDVLVIDFSQID